MFTAAERVYGLDISSLQLLALLCDFEPAEINGFQEFAVQELQLPALNVEGCHMHYCSAIIKHIKDLGLAAFYRNDDTKLKQFIAKLFALAFLPAAFIIPVYQALKDQLGPHMKADSAMMAFFTYYEDQWLYNQQLRKEYWSVFNRTFPSTRTDNDLEGKHRYYLFYLLCCE